MKNRVLLLGGALATVVYVLTVVMGGLMRPGYSHIAQAVSDLIATGAPNKPLLDPLFGVYNLLAMAFAMGLYRLVRAQNADGRAIGVAGAVVLLVQGAAGLATLFFPEPEGGMNAAITATGTMHIVFASVSSLTTMAAMLLMGLWFRKTPALRAYGMYSFLSVAAVFVSGGLAAASIATQSPVGGLMERITIGGFLQWMLVLAWKLSGAEAKAVANMEKSGARASV